MHVGSRDRAGTEALWKSLPPVYRRCAVCYTDFRSAYEQVLPQNRHRAVGKESGKTNHIERFNLKLRQRISRSVRKTLSFSKKIENNFGAIWNFIHYYNAEIAPNLRSLHIKYYTCLFVVHVPRARGHIKYQQSLVHRFIRYCG